MSGIVDYLRAAIQPAAAARAGYLEGQSLERDKQRAERIQDTALKRQSVLDQIKASVDSSTITRNRAQADRYGRMNTAAPKATYQRGVDEDGTVWDINVNDPSDVKPVMVNGRQMKQPKRAPAATPGPSTITTSKGIMLWNPAKKKYEPTGYEAPPRSTTGADAQERLDAKTALDEATKDVPRPSKVPANVLGKDAKGRATMVPNPDVAKVTSDSLGYETNTLKPLRQHLLDVTVGDKVKLGKPDGGSGTADLTKTRYRQTREQSAAMKADYDSASSDLKAVLNSNAPDKVKAQARALYDQQQANITKKYGAASGSPDEEL
jgi:hypothetical protein